MNVLVTGAAGFVGRHLVERLLAQGTLATNDGATSIERIVAADRGELTALGDDRRLVLRQGDVGDSSFARSLVDPAIGAVFHLAGVVSGAAEADFDLGLRANLDGTRWVLEASRAHGQRPRFVFSSSIAVFGRPLPVRIDDDTMPVPTLSYGVQKLACEHLLNDYTRRGFVDGRAVRLSGVVVRPRQPNGALSAFNSDIIREPLAGRALTAPVSAKARIWVLSVDQAVRNLLHAAALPADALGQQRAVTLPAVSATIGEILDALSTARGESVWPLVRFAPDPAIEPMFGRWPREHPAGRARALGFTCDADLASIVRACAGAPS